MFTHQQTLDAINAGLRALGRKELDGIPQAQPDHYRCCVLGCAYGARLSTDTLQDHVKVAAIGFETSYERDAVLDAWRDEGVSCEEYGKTAIRFTGGLMEWMQAFDGGKWKQLVDTTADPSGFDTVPPNALPPIAA